jgi:hypothetical protein
MKNFILKTKKTNNVIFQVYLYYINIRRKMTLTKYFTEMERS